MMTDFGHLTAMNEDKVLDWLKRALDNLESLPKLTPDEPPHCAIARLREKLSDHYCWKRFLEDATLKIIREFCKKGEGDSYTEELLFLVSTIKSSAAIAPLAKLAQSEAFSSLPDSVQFALLATLIDTPPCQSVEFWKRMYEKNPKYAGYAFSGILAQNFNETLLFLSSLEKESVKPRFWTGAQLKVSISELPAEEQAILIKKIESLAPPEE